MENLTIISTSITVQATQQIEGNTANFTWNHLQGELPFAVNFNVQRGIPGSENFTGNNFVTGAFYPETNKYDFNNNDLQPGDEDLYMPILAVCKGIVQEIES